jgi:hypothetical protein
MTSPSAAPAWSDSQCLLQLLNVLKTVGSFECQTTHDSPLTALRHFYSKVLG